MIIWLYATLTGFAGLTVAFFFNCDFNCAVLFFYKRNYFY